MAAGHIRIVVVEDQALVRQGLVALLGLVPDMEVVGQAGNGQDALALVGGCLPDVVLMDVRMPGVNGVVATREIRARWPATQVLVLTTFDDDEFVFESLRAGAAGYLLKNANLEHLVAAIRAVHAGQAMLDPAVTARVIERARSSEPLLQDRLTAREREVLRLVADGLSSGEIAARLHLSEGTVKNHVTHILAKLHARDRAHAVRLAAEWGLIRD